MRAGLFALLLLLCQLPPPSFCNAKPSSSKCSAQVQHSHFRRQLPYTIFCLIQVLTSYAPLLAFKQMQNDELIASAREALIATKLDVALKVHSFFSFDFFSVYC
jgi:hypothetical protein